MSVVDALLRDASRFPELRTTCSTMGDASGRREFSTANLEHLTPHQFSRLFTRAVQALRDAVEAGDEPSGPINLHGLHITALCVDCDFDAKSPYMDRRLAIDDV